VRVSDHDDARAGDDHRGPGSLPAIEGGLIAPVTDASGLRRVYQIDLQVGGPPPESLPTTIKANLKLRLIER
jgi:hypothetical protein